MCLQEVTLFAMQISTNVDFNIRFRHKSDIQRKAQLL